MSTILTSKADCRDCYKCIRYCPVKAIGLKDGQAWVVEEKCILRGQCIVVCPQQAKSMVSQLPLLEKYLSDGERVIISLAPSYLGSSFYSTPWKLVAALNEAGIFRVEGTILGAKPVAAEYGKLMRETKEGTIITSCCPTTVNIIEKYFPSLVPSLSPIISRDRCSRKVVKGAETYDFIEGMGCEGGCVGGPGTLVNTKVAVRALRKETEQKGVA